LDFIIIFAVFIICIIILVIYIADLPSEAPKPEKDIASRTLSSSYQVKNKSEEFNEINPFEYPLNRYSSQSAEIKEPPYYPHTHDFSNRKIKREYWAEKRAHSIEDNLKPNIPVIEYSCICTYDTEKAIYVRGDKGKNFLPKSQIKMNFGRIYYDVEVEALLTIPRWLAKKKGICE